MFDIIYIYTQRKGKVMAAARNFVKKRREKPSLGVRLWREPEWDRKKSRTNKGDGGGKVLKATVVYVVVLLFLIFKFRV